MFLNQLLFLSLFALPCLSCPDGWIGFGESCYRISPDPMSWYDSQQFCAQEGADIAEIRDADEQASLFSFLPTELNYWIGLTDLASEGVYVWQTDFTETTYTNWREGEPNNSYGTEDCVHLYVSFLWNDLTCDVNYIPSEPAGYIHALCETENV